LVANSPRTLNFGSEPYGNEPTASANPHNDTVVGGLPLSCRHLREQLFLETLCAKGLTRAKLRQKALVNWQVRSQCQ
jgi:hypothetical protein